MNICSWAFPDIKDVFYLLNEEFEEKLCKYKYFFVSSQKNL